MTTTSPLTPGGPVGGRVASLRLLMGPVGYRTTGRQAFPLQLDNRCRWVQELNGHPRQHQVLGLLTQGLDNRAIARELGVNEKTVRNAITDAYACLGVRNRVLAALVYRRICEGPG